jgi:hypothetical protein
MVDSENVFSIKIDKDYIGCEKYPVFQNMSNKNEPDGQAQCAIILGHNGSGKSTIAQAFKDNTSPVEFLDEKGELVEGDNENIYLFDEQFIINNFRKFEDDCLGSIVLLGESVQIQGEIDELRVKVDQKKKRKDDYELGISRRSYKKDELIKKINNTISYKDESRFYSGSWKGRTQYYNINNQYKIRPPGYIERIKGDSRNIEDMPAKDTLLKDFLESVDNLNKLSNFQKVHWIPKKLTLPFSLNKIAESIKAVQMVNELNSEDKYYERVCQSSVGVEELMRRIEVTFSSDSSFCPHCFQDIEEGIKGEIIESINKYVVSVNSNREIQELHKLKFSWRPEKQDLPNIPLPEGMRESIEDDFCSLVEICEQINNAIQEKVDNPDKDVNLDGLNPDIIVDRINQNYEEILKMVEKYNSQGEDVDSMRSKCEDLNHDIAIIETYADIQNLKAIEDKILKIEQEKENIEREIADDLEKLRIEEAKLRSESEAANKINSLLSIVFGPGVITLDAGGEYGYRVVNKGKNVPPSRLSTGEQNILSLCYFFVKIADGEEYENSLSNNKIIILDDPISSFDYDNKFGVIKLLGYVIRKIFSKGSSSRLLITTHDIFVAHELSKLIAYVSNDTVLQCWHLQDELISTNFEYIDEYSEMLGRMYRFAADENAEAFLMPASNEVRRVWEAFLRFEMGQSSVASRSSIEKIQEFFRDNEMKKEYEFVDKFISQVFINEGSHSGHQMLGDNISLQPAMDPVNFQRFVKEILSFMHLVSPHHIALRMGGGFENIDDNRKEMDRICEEIVGS